MPKILITGNGFDLSLGLPTLYKDFISVMEYIEESDNSITYHNIYDCTSQKDTIVGENKKNDVNSEKIEKLKSLLKNSLWYQFFKTEYNINTWIDFENSIEFAINNLIKFGDNSKKFIKQYQYKHFVNIHVEKFEDPIEYKIAEQFKLFEQSGNYILKSEFIEKRDNLNISFNFDHLADYLYEGLNVFIKIFSKYFQYFVLPLVENLNETNLSNISRNYTFNYTPTFDILQHNQFNKVPTSFLHGKIESKNQNIVLGIDKFIGENNENLKGFLKFKKSNQVFQKETDKFDIEVILDSFGQSDIIFFGHSMDKSDSYYINKVFDLVKKEEPSQMGLKNTIIIYCYDQDSRNKIISNLQTMRNEIELQELREKGKLIITTNKSELKDLIYKNDRYF